MKQINLFILAILMSLTLNALSQDLIKEKSEIVRPFQMSFITPMGTNGMESSKVTNIFSLNLFAGYSGGLSGFELAGFSNIIKGKTKGMQIAGFSNTNRNNVEGFQISGFSNFCLGSVKGMQIAGFANVVKDSIEAFQLAGFSNLSKGMKNGGQISGFANINHGDATGIQVAGFTNINNGESKGGQISGFANISKGETEGMQIAGFTNVSEDLRGVQISGFLNKAKKVNGLQFGFINVADTVEKGITFGFLSIVKKGYRTVEIGGNETFYGSANFKTGTEAFYNIISLGAKIDNNNIIWAWGYGIGTMFPVHENVKLNFDVVSYQVNEGEWFTNRLNMLNKASLAVNYKLNDYVTIYGGPTWNVQVSDTYDKEGIVDVSSFVSWSVYDKTKNRTNVKMYPGFTFGIRL